MSTSLIFNPKVEKSSKDILVVGVGNRLLGDEGMGLYIIDTLLQYQIPDYVDVINCGCDLLNLISYPNKPQKLIIVDTIRAGGKPGETYKFNYNQLETPAVKMSSAHQIHAIDALRLLRELYPNLADCEVVVIGIEPKTIKLNAGLSKWVNKSITGAVRLVLGELS